MKRKEELPELLAPAGDFDALIAAVAAGADAVYIGGKSFSARAFAENFETEDIRRAVRYCHIHDVRLYVALNTLIYDREMSSAVEYAAELYRVGVDALICADIGVIREIKRVIPDFEIHASTQMSVHNSLGADEARRLGVSRVVLARELSLEDIRSTVNVCEPECEIFLHGALCVCHSGQCLFSSMVGGRSGNRGECAQPCRLPYNGKYPLSLRDLSLAEHIPELVASGVASLKIEGRMKSPEYVYGVTSIYRRLLDERRCATAEECAELARIFSRGGFTDGYITGRLSSNMTGIRSEADKGSSRMIVFVPKEQKRSVRAEVRIKADRPSELTLQLGKRSVRALGAVPTRAISSPLTEDTVAARICKMGNTDLALLREDVVCDIDEGLNLSPAELNALRREAAEALESCDRRLVCEYEPLRKRKSCEQPLKTAICFKPEELSRYIKRSRACFFDIVFIPLFSDVMLDIPKEKLGVYLPPVITECELAEVKARLEKIRSKGIMYALVGNIGHFSLASEAGLLPIGDFRLNVTNSMSAEHYRALGAKRLLLSPEITLPMARDISGGEIVYGRIPLMLTERCFISENFGCDKCAADPALTDRQGARFPMMREWEHRNIIFNSVKTNMSDRQSELEKYGILHTHFIFSDESAAEIAKAVQTFKQRIPSDEKSIRRIGSLTAQTKGCSDSKPQTAVPKSKAKAAHAKPGNFQNKNAAASFKKANKKT